MIATYANNRDFELLSHTENGAAMMRPDYDGAELGIIWGPQASRADRGRLSRTAGRGREHRCGVVRGTPASATSRQTQGTADDGSGSDGPHDEAG